MYRSVILSSILRSTRSSTGAKITQIQYEAYLPYTQLKEYLIMMIQNKLITYVSDEKIFKITQDGIHVLSLYDEFDKLLVYNRQNTQMKI